MQLIYTKDNDLFTSKVYKKDNEAIKYVWPKTEQAYNRLTKEFDLIEHIDSEYFANYLWADLGDYYRVATEWIDYTPITDFYALKDGLQCILPELDKANIRHRDIWFKNILIKDNKPILIDFGWAINKDNTDDLDPILPYANDEDSMQILLNYVEKQCQ